MSRSPHLPPRCPPLGPQITRRDDSLFTQSCRFPSEDPFVGEPPCWLDDLLADSGKSHTLPPLRRACSDSDAILDVLTTFQSPIYPIDEGDPQPVGEAGESFNAAAEGGGSGAGIEGSCVYGPNSPRQKTRLTSSESSMVNAVLENVPSNPLQYLMIDATSGVNCNVGAANGTGDTGDAVCHADQEKSLKRRSGQRSRVRKLQYIADLERTVDSLQNIGADLAVRVASLFQLRNALSMENKQLRRQITSLQQAKLIKDGQTQMLKKETERLKQLSVRHRRSRSVTSCFEANSFGGDPSAINWQMLDMSKLSLNGGAVVPPRGGYGM
uniref:BZIP domain-containing protein n=1 Tax=Oryza glumipatula TaxID=40148 RepID=A0A0D9YTB2_9ORYZ